MRREKLPAAGLDPRGRPIGILTAEGPSAVGEVTVPRSERVLQAVRDLSEEIEREPLPLELREQVERYYDAILGRDEDSPR